MAMSGDLSREELVSQGRSILDWIAGYLEHPEQYPVLSKLRPGDVRASLPPSPPASGEKLEAILRDFETKIIPGITHWNHPAFFIKRPDVLKRAFSLVPEYLVTREQDEVVNYMDYGVQLGRRFRALKLWMIIRAFGTDGLAERLRAHCALAREFAGWVKANGDWTLMAPVPFALVCFRMRRTARAMPSATA